MKLFVAFIAIVLVANMTQATSSDKKQEKRYAYNGIGIYGNGLDTLSYYNNNPYGSRIWGQDNYSGYGGYGGYAGYGGYGTYAGVGVYNPYINSYYNRIGGYPYTRPGYGYNSYPSSYYSSNYANSIIGSGIGGLSAGVISAVPTAGYQYGPGVSGTIY
ncbi:keratin-associated protein 19-2 isoform X2 [Teleopsis dalmanni]|uniref:keratin-associated protein 19-2 isoform X2 n=1 Tax=Teleopsis dalmanni TaxID=139649 RepID=UPI0018CDFCE3|nr:keratin-associated protein 19-2 isoform X2 [Teleopsis dalmanni]